MDLKAESQNAQPNNPFIKKQIIHHGLASTVPEYVPGSKVYRSI